MWSLRKYYIGVAIDNSFVRLAAVSRYKDKYQFHYYSCPLSDISFSAYSFKTNKIILSVSDVYVLTKKVCLGRQLSKKEKRDYLAFEMEKIVLCSKEEFYLDFKVVENIDNKKQEVFCATVRRKVLDDYENIFKNSLFKIDKITIDSELETCHVSELPAEYQKAASIALSGFKKNGFNFLSWNDKNYQRYQVFKKAIGVSFVIFTLLFAYVFLTKKLYIQPEIGIVLPKKKTIVSREEHYGTSLQDAPFHRFKVLGSLKGKREIWGVIQTPDKKICSLKIGDIVGFEQVKVVKILPRSIVLMKNGRRYTIE